MNGDDAIILQQLWDEHVAWSAAADKLKSRLTTARKIALTLTIAGAALQTLAVTWNGARFAVGMAGTVALALVPFIGGYFLTAADTRRWLRARSISEAIKSEFFRFRASADPYHEDGALDRLLRKVREIRKWGEDMEVVRSRAAFTPGDPPPSLDAAAYLQRRIAQQVSQYYRPKAKQNASLAEQFRFVQILLAGIAAVLSALATFLSGNTSGTASAFGPWVAVVTTIGGSLAAHAAAARYEFQATTFSATARQLEDLSQDWQSSKKASPSPEWSAFVRDCEEVISAENRGWMAKLDDPSK